MRRARFEFAPRVVMARRLANSYEKAPLRRKSMPQSLGPQPSAFNLAGQPPQLHVWTDDTPNTRKALTEYQDLGVHRIPYRNE